ARYDGGVSATLVRQVILDFDGTCTLVEEVQREFLDEYRRLIAGEWSEPAAPAAADPYILSGEIVGWIDRSGRVERRAPAGCTTAWYKAAYLAHPAPWRGELRGLLADLVGRGLRVAFISNSKTETIRDRVDS